MIREEDGRSVIHCNRCPVRLDLGAAAIVNNHPRMPSAWLQDGHDSHLCPFCARKEIELMVANPALRELGGQQTVGLLGQQYA